MRTRFSLWRMLLLLLPLMVVVTSAGRTTRDATLHISPQFQGAPLPDGFYIYQQLNEHGIGIKSITPSHGNIVVRLSSAEQSAQARDVLSHALPQANVIAKVPQNVPFWRQTLSQLQSRLG